MLLTTGVVQYLGKYRDAKRDDTSINAVTVYRVSIVTYQVTYQVWPHLFQRILRNM